MRNLIFLLFISLVGCGLIDDTSGVKDTAPPIENYISEVAYLEDFIPKYADWPEGTIVSHETFQIVFQSTSEEASTKPYGSKGDWKFRPFTTEEWKEFHKMVEDTNYNRAGDTRYKFMVFGQELSRIDISLDKVFNDSIAADQSINELINVSYLYPGLVTKNGYSDLGLNLIGTEHLKIEKLSEMNISGNKLGVGVTTGFKLLQAPMKTDTFRFHIKYTFGDGLVLETTTPPAIIRGLEE
jgi:ribosomal protein L20A (L18A)